MKCIFPGDLFVKLPKLEYLYLSYNELMVSNGFLLCTSTWQLAGG